MGDEKPIRTLGDYSKPSHEGYRNTIELPVGNNVVPLRSNTIRLVQNGCSFHELWSEDPNQHLKAFLKLVDSLDLDGPSPQPQALETTFEARVRDYMATHTKRMERFENTIFKQREEINDRMTEMFGLLKELTTSKIPKKELIKEEAKFPVTKNEVEKMNEVENGDGNKSIETSKNEEAVETPGTQVRKKKGKEYKVLPGGPAYDAILKKKITKKEDIGGNFEIPCSIGNLKHVNALVDQGFDVNVMPYSTCMRLTDKRPTETNIRLSLASHSYIYPLGIAEDVLVEVAEHIFPVDFVILDIKENENRPFILGTPFLTTAKATRVKNNMEPIAPIMTVNRLVLEWEERIKLHLKKEMKFN
ncbi:MAK10-like protein [Tanacetum coccineum]|uniref:MAK10-like protein n=1 Tax=Tanacetum coccineum TaxID=301880 RepID=A0ABQ5HXK0_9ASTR